VLGSDVKGIELAREATAAPGLAGAPASRYERTGDEADDPRLPLPHAASEAMRPSARVSRIVTSRRRTSMNPPSTRCDSTRLAV